MKLKRRRRRQRPAPWVPEHDDEDGYSGPARLSIGDDTIDVEVVLGGHLEPLDGRYHWYGRVVRTRRCRRGEDRGRHGSASSIDGRESAEGRLAEHDAWGNMRITGLGAPPFSRAEVEITHVRP